MYEILKTLFSKKKLELLSDSLIISLPNGYELFGEYLISKQKNVYTVSKYYTDLNESFYSLQNATVYCIFHKRNDIVRTKRITEIDLLLEGARANIQLYKSKIQSCKDIEIKSIFLNKLNEAVLHRKHILSEMEDYATDSRKWQERRFKEAIK